MTLFSLTPVLSNSFAPLQTIPQLQAAYPTTDIMLIGVPVTPGKERPLSPGRSDRSDSPASPNVSEVLNSVPISLGRARQLNPQQQISSSIERKRFYEPASFKERHLSTDSKSSTDPLVGFQEVTFANQDAPPLSVGSELIMSDSNTTGPRPTSVSSLDSYGDTTYGSTPQSTSDRAITSSSVGTAFTLSSPVSPSSFGSPASVDIGSPIMRWRSRHHPSTRILPDPVALQKIAVERAQEAAHQLTIPLFIAPEYEPMLFSSPPGSFSAANVPPAIAALISSVVPPLAASAAPSAATHATPTPSAPIATNGSPTKIEPIVNNLAMSNSPSTALSTPVISPLSASPMTPQDGADPSPNQSTTSQLKASPSMPLKSEFLRPSTPVSDAPPRISDADSADAFPILTEPCSMESTIASNQTDEDPLNETSESRAEDLAAIRAGSSSPPPLSTSPISSVTPLTPSPQTVAAASQVIAFFEALAIAYQPQWLKQAISSYKKLGLDISIADKKTMALVDVWRPYSQKGSGYVTGLSLCDLGLKSSLPDFVLELTNLVSVSLSGNNLNESHMKIIFQLGHIQTLNLSRNLIRVLSPEVSRLVELTDLDLSHNLLETLPSQIGECSQLVRVDVSYNNILALPYALARCPLSQLLTVDNPLSTLPPKARTEPRAIWAYLKHCYQDSPTERWNRLRLMVVGPENIGKTRLIRRLSRRDYAPLSTDGIEVETFKLKIQKQKAGDSKFTSFDIRAYDFGGQEVFYPTHSFFIGPRSLFIAAFKLVPDIEAVNWQALEYWLRTIKLLAGSETQGKPSVIIVGTHLDEFESRAPSDHHREILTAITKRIQSYDTLVHIRTICFISNKSKKGLDTLRTAILSRAEKEEVMKTPIPSSWAAMDTFLNCLIERSSVAATTPTNVSLTSSSSGRELSSKPSTREGFFSSFSIRSFGGGSSNNLGSPQLIQSLRFISWQQFVEYAHMFNITTDEEIRDMATFLHDMGSVLWFNSTTMRDVVILDPQWLSEVMASIISMKVRWKDGELPHSALANIWKAYPPQMHATLLSFLEHFEVVYPLKGTDKTIVPCMFNDEPGDVYKAEAAMIAANSERISKFARKYRFKGFLPLGFFDRMIVRIMHVQGVKLTSSWRYGIVMRTATGSAGNVSFDSSKKLLLVTVIARSNTDILFPSILDSIESLIKTSYRNVKVARKIVAASPLVSALQPEEFDYDAVLDAFHRGERTFMCGKVAVPIEDMAPDICMCFIPELKNVTIQEPIGRGGFGVVYRGQWSGSDVAIKEVLFKSALSSANTDAFRQFAHEVWIMSKLSHPNLVHLHGITLHPLRMIMEFCPGMDLCNFLATNPRVATEPQYDLLRLRIALDVAKGMQYIHNLSPPVIHRDLRSPNVFVVSTDDNAEIVSKIGDFGLAEYTAHGLNEALPTWQWLPPETFNAIGNFKYNERCDRWSYGIVLWEIYTGQEPFSEYFQEPRFAAPATEGPTTPRSEEPDYMNSSQSTMPTGTPRGLASSSASFTSPDPNSSTSATSPQTGTPSEPRSIAASTDMLIVSENSAADSPSKSSPSQEENKASELTLNREDSDIDPMTPKRPSRGATMCNVQNVKTAIANEGLRPTIPKHVPHAVKELITRCWHADPMMRPDFGEILNILQTVATDAGLTAMPAPVQRPVSTWRSTGVSQRANYFRHPISRSLHSSIPLESGVLSLAYNATHTEIWAGCSDGNVRIFNCKTRVRNVEVHPVSNSHASNARIHQLLYVSRKHPLLDAGSSDASSSVASIDQPKPTLTASWPSNAPTSTSAGGNVLDRIWSVSDRIVVWNPESRLLEKELFAPHTSVVRAMLYLESKQQVWTADVSGLVCVWDVNTYDLISTIVAPELSNAPIFCMCYIEDTDTVWMGSYAKLIVVRASERTVVDAWEAHSGYRIMAMSVAGSTVWTGSELRICLWDKTTRKAIIDASTNLPAERLVEFGVVSLITIKRPNEGLHVWSGDSNGTVTVWHADNPALATSPVSASKPANPIFQVLSNHKKDSVHAILSLDDGTVCTGSYGNPNSKTKDNSICLWQYD